jgi:hypothetical protein
LSSSRASEMERNFSCFLPMAHSYIHMSCCRFASELSSVSCEAIPKIELKLAFLAKRPGKVCSRGTKHVLAWPSGVLDDIFHFDWTRTFVELTEPIMYHPASAGPAALSISSPCSTH